MSERSSTVESERPFRPLYESVLLDREDTEETLAKLQPVGTVVLLLAGSDDREWATYAATEISSAWAGAGRRIVLADLHVESPLLRPAGATDSLEGIVDIFLYGASLSRIAKPAPGGAYYVIPVGTYTLESPEIFRHPRWKKLVAGFRDTSATLLLLVPEGEQDAMALREWSSEVVLLGTAASEETAARVRENGFAVLADVQAPRSSGTSAGKASAISGRGKTAVQGVTHDADDQPELPPPVRRRAGRRGPALLLIVLLLIVILGAAVYVAVSLRPDFFSSGGVDPPTTAQASVVSSASREGQPLTFSIQVKAFESLAAAREQVALEQARFPSTPFFISPEEIQGIVYYKILAGLASDTTSAQRLRDRLVAAGSISEEDAIGSWALVQSAPLAFDLGEYPTREAAAARADSLMDTRIPAYIARVPYSDGTRRWQVYGGAYRDTYNASRMSSLLSQAGLPAQITLRMGDPVTGTE